MEPHSKMCRTFLLYSGGHLGHYGPVTALASQPKSSIILSASTDRRAKLIDTNSGKVGHTGDVVKGVLLQNISVHDRFYFKIVAYNIGCLVLWKIVDDVVICKRNKIQ